MREQIKGTILIISHQERILNIADEIIMIADGKVTKTGQKQDMLLDIIGATLEGGICGRIATQEGGAK